MWKTVRVTVLLLVLVVVAGRAWIDRVQTQSWKNTLWVGIFPLNGDDSPEAERYISTLTQDDFSSIETRKSSTRIRCCGSLRSTSCSRA